VFAAEPAKNYLLTRRPFGTFVETIATIMTMIDRRPLSGSTSSAGAGLAQSPRASWSATVVGAIASCRFTSGPPRATNSHVLSFPATNLRTWVAFPWRWRSLSSGGITGSKLASAVARLLGFTEPQHEGGALGKRWKLGLRKGKEHKGEVKLAVESCVSLMVAGHTVALARRGVSSQAWVPLVE
jgi:hypothetical protein